MYYYYYNTEVALIITARVYWTSLMVGLDEVTR